MHPNQQLIDDIVSQIMGQLMTTQTVQTTADSAAKPTAEKAPVAKAATPAAQPTGKLLADKVITKKLLAETIGKTKEVIFEAGTIVTPAARDWLKANGVAWRMSSATAAKQSATSSRHRLLALVVSKTASVQTALQAVIGHGKADWRQETVTDQTQAVAAAISAICRADADAAVIVSDTPELVACQANRQSKVHAVAVSEAARLKRLCDEMDVNVVCLSPAGRSFIEMRNILNVLAEAN